MNASSRPAFVYIYVERCKYTNNLRNSKGEEHKLSNVLKHTIFITCLNCTDQ